jgi:GH24 family phage-related lysozyme (muramidase)
MRVSESGINLIKQFEGCELTAYQDSVSVWTIGYGWTHPVNGKKIDSSMTIDQQTAEQLLKSGVVQYEQGVSQLVNVGINQNQFDALVDFAYNLGVDALKGSTLLKKLNAGDYAGAADEFPKWVNAGGVRLNGLVKRRNAERELFLS